MGSTKIFLFDVSKLKKEPGIVDVTEFKVYLASEIVNRCDSESRKLNEGSINISPSTPTLSSLIAYSLYGALLVTFIENVCWTYKLLPSFKLTLQSWSPRRLKLF